MLTRRLVLCFLAALAAAVALNGCGGGGSGVRSSVGALRVTAEFPPLDGPGDVSGRVIPEGTQSIYVGVTSPEGVLLGEALLTRPTNGQLPPGDVIMRQKGEPVQATATIDDLPLGPALVTAEAHGPSTNQRASARQPGGPPLASASTKVNIEPGVNELALSLVSHVALVEVIPSSATIPVGGSQPFLATAKDGDGVILLGCTFDWSCDNGAVAGVDQWGLAVGAGSGTCSIVATEKASGVQGSAALGVGGQLNGEVLIIQDRSPWGYNPNVQVCNDLGYNCTMIGSSLLSPAALPGVTLAQQVDFSQFNVVVLSGDQDDGYYANVEAGLGQLAGLFAANGVLVVHYATGYGLLPTPRAILPGGSGIAWTVEFGADLDIIDPGSGLITQGTRVITDTNLDGGNHSYHGWAAANSLPAGAEAMLAAVAPPGVAQAALAQDPSRVAVLMYDHGGGEVLVSTIPVEWYDAGSHGSQPDIGTIYHYNEFEYAMQVAQTLN